MRGQDLPGEEQSSLRGAPSSGGRSAAWSGLQALASPGEFWCCWSLRGAGPAYASMSKAEPWERTLASEGSNDGDGETECRGRKLRGRAGCPALFQ